MHRSFITLFATLVLVGSAFGQHERKLLGTWSGGEDFSEFIYHTIEKFKSELLPKNASGKFFIVLCSSDPLPHALIKTKGAAVGVPFFAREFLGVPRETIFFATSRACRARTEQYWFVPNLEESTFFDVTASTRVSLSRWEVDNDGPNGAKESVQLRKFDENIADFVRKLKADQTTTGFILHSRSTIRSLLERLKRKLRDAGLPPGRLTMVTDDDLDPRIPQLVAVEIDRKSSPE